VNDTTTTIQQEEKTEVLPVADQAPASEGAPTEKPKVADAVELIGEYEGSGFKEPPYLARRPDGQVVQLAPLLYLIAEASDGVRTNEEIAAAVSEAIKRGVSADNVRQLVDERLRPLGVIAPADGSQPELVKADPLLALKLRAALVPERVVNAVTTIFKPLFFPPLVIAVLGGLVALDVWLFAYHGVAQSMREVLYSPALLMMMLGLVIVSAAFHECGHATACAYGGARPGVMGAGVYIVWPAFYTDVTDAYRLGKAGRLRTDLGGVYFNVIFILATGAAYALTGFEPLLLIIPFQHLEIVHQFLPFIRLDGYYIVSDLTGVPDMFARIKPTLASLIPGRKPSDRVTELKSWVRVAVTAYVLSVVPLLLFMFGLMLINAPRIISTAWDSFFVQYHKVQAAFDAGALFDAIFGILQMVILVLPALGIVATFWMAASRVTRSVWTRTEGRPAARASASLIAAAAAAFLAYTWWPNGDYRPIQPDEKGTVQGALVQVSHVSTGRPALTRERESQLRGAPSQSSPDEPNTRPIEQSPKQTTQTETSSPTQTPATPPPEGSTDQPTTPAETTTTETIPTETTTTTTTATTTADTALTP
jgi:putative peptide zinc metalloprotease protein